jgi:hypothetical protein
VARPPGTHATIGELLAAAAKLDRVADEIEQTGHQVGGAAAAATALMPGFTLGLQSVTTCGHLHQCIGDTVRDMRIQAQHLRDTAATYTESDRQAQAAVTVTGRSAG